MKYILFLFILQIIYINRVFSQEEYTYIFVYNIKFGEFDVNDTFFISIQNCDSINLKNTDSLLTIINQLNKRIYYSESGLYSQIGEQQKIDSVDLFLYKAKNNFFKTELILDSCDFIIKKIVLSSPLNWILFKPWLMEAVPIFFKVKDGKCEIRKTFLRRVELFILD